MNTPALNLIVVYVSDLEASRAFYADLGLHLCRERHGDGPGHYSAQLHGGVMELYPAGDGAPTRTRLHLVVPGATDGTHRNPDGNTVRVWAPVSGYPPAEHLTVGALHALTRGWPAERPVMLRIGEGVPHVAVYGSQIGTERFHGADRHILLLADHVEQRPACDVVAVEVAGPATIRVTHRDGTVADHDLSRVIDRGGAFAPLRDADLFRQVRIEGGAVTWPGGLDLAPDALWDHAHGRCGDCGWTAAETTVITLPATPPATVGDLIARLHQEYPEGYVLAPAPLGGYGHIRIGEAVVQQRTAVPTGEGRYIDPATAAGDGPIGPAFPAVTIAWLEEEK